MPLVPPVQPWPAQPLGGRVVLVTGGAQGIGRGIAQAVLGAGGAVVIGDSDVDAGHACIEEWDAGAAAMFVRLDVAKEASIRRFVDAAAKAYARIDGLVNNAAIADPDAGPLEKLDLATWNRYLATGLTSALLCTRQALPQLRESKGAVVNIASTRALQSEPDTEAYAAVKGGLVALTHALAMSLGPDVRVNCISPGWVPTDAWRKPNARRRLGGYRAGTTRSIPSAARARRRTSARSPCTCSRRPRASPPARTSWWTAACRGACATTDRPRAAAISPTCCRRGSDSAARLPRRAGAPRPSAKA